MQLTEKETLLLKDMQAAEKLCIEKYNKHASCAVDPQLKTLFSDIEQTEKEHLNTLNQIESGTVPNMQANASSSSQQQTTFTATYGVGENQDKLNDSYLCTDVLSAEKHTSSLYNTCIFEFTDTNVRDVLNHIQKEEQEHGKKIYDYMATNGMYG